MKRELQKKEHDKYVKLVPQRLFNAYHYDDAHYKHAPFTYQKGDFVIHFPAVRCLDSLEALFVKYSQLIVYDYPLFMSNLHDIYPNKLKS